MDFSLSFMEISGLILVLFLWSYTIAREIEWKTLYLVFSKPIQRGSVIFGKFIGFMAILWVLILIESSVFMTVLLIHELNLTSIFFIAILGIYMKLLSILSIILFFGVFTSPMVTLFTGIMSYIIGHSGYAVIEYATQIHNNTLLVIGKIILAIFPNLSSLNIKNMIDMPIPPSVWDISLGFFINSIYILILLFFWKWAFEKKSFETL
jgi:Cu-processing system permease protein